MTLRLSSNQDGSPSKSDTLLHQPDLGNTKEDKLGFRQLLRSKNVTPKTFIEISAVEYWFQEDTIHPENTKHFVNVHILGITNPADCEILDILTREEPDI